MAVGNAIVQTAKFKPLSFQEWAAPLQVLNEAQAQNEATLSQLSAEADEYERYIREHPNDPISIQYNNYLNNIEKQATALANEGITPQSRTDLLNLYRDYNKTIKPVKTGVTAYQAYQQNRLKADDGTLLGPSLGVWDFIQNPEQQYNFVKGSTVQAEAARAAASASARRRTDPQYKKVLGGQYYEISNPVGFTPEEVKTWVANPNTSPELTNIYNQLTEKYKDFSPQELSDYIVRGIYDGITYDNKTSYHANKNYDLAQQRALARYKASLEGKDKDASTGSVLTRRPANATQSKDQKSLAKKVERYKELRDKIKADPSIYEAKEPKRILKSEYDLGTASAINKKGLGNSSLITTYNPYVNNTYNPNYEKEKEKYKIKKEFDELESELRDTLFKQYPNANLNFTHGTEATPMPANMLGLGVGVGTRKTFQYDSNIDEYLDNLANLTSGYNYEVTPAEMQAITQNIWINSGLGMEKGKTALDNKTDLILDEKGKPVKRDKLKDLDRTNTWIYIGSDGRHHFDYKGDTYTVMEEAIDNELGSLYFGDKNVTDANGNTLQAGRLRQAWANGQYDYYNQGVREFANRVVAGTRSRIPAIGGTSSTYDASNLE